MWRALLLVVVPIVVVAGSARAAPAELPRQPLANAPSAAPVAPDDERALAADDGIPPWDAAIPLYSAAGCVGGALLGPLLPLGLGIPAAFYLAENPDTLPLPISDPGCVSLGTVLTFALVGLATMAPCSALGATLAAFSAAWANDRSLWRPLVGGVPGVVCAVLAPLSCLCFPLPGGSVLTIIGLAIGAFGGPLAVLGASLADAQLAERAFALVAGGKRDDDDEGERSPPVDEMHY